MATGSRNGIVRVVVGITLTAFIALLTYTFRTFASNINTNQEMAAQNKHELAVRSLSVAKIPAFETTLQAIQIKQAEHGIILSAIAKKVGVE